MDKLLASGPACEFCGGAVWVYTKIGATGRGVRAKCTRCGIEHVGLRLPRGAFTSTVCEAAHAKWTPRRSKRPPEESKLATRLAEFCRRTGRSANEVKAAALAAYLEREGS